MRYSTILLIDDDLDDLDIFSSIIQSLPEPAETCTVDDAMTALAKLDARELTPDLIFLDLNMPVMSGKEFLQKLKQRESLAHIPVIVLSTTNRPETIRELRALGAADFIIKPSEFEKARSIFQNLLIP
jgi:CheY-like chemotaxis protein